MSTSYLLGVFFVKQTANGTFSSVQTPVKACLDAALQLQQEWRSQDKASIDVEAHRFAIYALVDMFVTDAFHASALQAAAFYDVNSNLLCRLHSPTHGSAG